MAFDTVFRYAECRYAEYRGAVCPWQSFQPSLMSVITDGSYLREAPFGVPLLGRLLALHENIRLGWKGPLPWTKTLKLIKNLHT
jgi:hypothetical protein